MKEKVSWRTLIIDAVEEAIGRGFDISLRAMGPALIVIGLFVFHDSAYSCH
jgi:hypothetical protein